MFVTRTCFRDANITGFCIILLFIHYLLTVVDQLPRLGKRELICLLLFTCNYVVSVWRGFLFLWVLRMGYVILLWHSLSLPYNHLSVKAQHLSIGRQIHVKLHVHIMNGCKAESNN